MADSRKIVKVFLASPGDLAEERRAAKVVVDEFNALFADDFGYQVELIGWEDTVAVFGRPQETINRELDRCELFVGLMWKKWGTPPDTAGPYTSGFEEEFERSVARRLKHGKPEISLLLKEVDPAFLGDPGEDLKKVLAFKARLIAERKILFEGFADLREFERRFRRCIANYVRQLRARDIDINAGKNQAPTTTGEKQQPAELKARRESPLSTEGVAFLRALLSKSESNLEEEPFEAAEVARFRLLSTLVGRQGNDERTLGVHDANLMFTDGVDFTLGKQEIAGLVTAGLRYYKDENVPFWTWFLKLDGFSRALLPFYSEIGQDSKRRAGALLAMQMVAEPIPDTERQMCLDRWFGPTTSSEVKTAALNYLKDWGVSSDVATIKKEFERNDNQTLSAAANALVAIKLRESPRAGLQAVYELQASSVNSETLDGVFAAKKQFGNEELLKGLEHADAKVRRRIVSLLGERNALTTEIAQKLLKDDDVQVRYQALKMLVESGSAYSDSDIRSLLVTQTRGLRGVLSWWGAPDWDSEQYMDTLRRSRLAQMKDKELEDAVSQDSMFERDAEFTLAERHFQSHGGQLRVRLADRFENAFKHDVESLAATLGAKGADAAEKTKALEDATRKKLTRRGLELLCRQMDPHDIDLVRATLRSGYIEEFSASEIEYLRKYGTWDDIELILRAVPRPLVGTRRGLLLGGDDEPKNKFAARAIYALGRTKLARLLGVEMPSGVLVHLIAEIPNQAFRKLSDNVLMPLLRSKADLVRKAVALKCVRVFGAARLTKLRKSYLAAQGSHYYNVIHWLDFGVALPRERAAAAAQRVIDAWRN